MFFKIRNKDNSQRSYFRLYVESSDILISLKSSDKDIKKDEVNSISESLSSGEYFITFDYSTKHALEKATIAKSSVHITVMIVTETYFTLNYYDY